MDEREIAMKKALISVLLILGTIIPVLGTAAERIMNDRQGNRITLLDGPCVSKAGMLAQLTPEARKIAKAASVFWQGKTYAACYAEADDMVFLVDEAGDQGILDAKAFLPVHGT